MLLGHRWAPRCPRRLCPRRVNVKETPSTEILIEKQNVFHAVILLVFVRITTEKTNKNSRQPLLPKQAQSHMRRSSCKPVPPAAGQGPGSLGEVGANGAPWPLWLSCPPHSPGPGLVWQLHRATRVLPQRGQAQVTPPLRCQPPALHPAPSLAKSARGEAGCSGNAASRENRPGRSPSL